MTRPASNAMILGCHFKIDPCSLTHPITLRASRKSLLPPRPLSRTPAATAFARAARLRRSGSGAAAVPPPRSTVKYVDGYRKAKGGRPLQGCSNDQLSLFLRMPVKNEARGNFLMISLILKSFLAIKDDVERDILRVRVLVQDGI